MAKILYSHTVRDVDSLGNTYKKAYSAFVASDKYKLRKEVLAEISKNDAKSFYDKLVGSYDYPGREEYSVCLNNSDLKRYKVDFYRRPVIEKLYVDDPDIFYELVDRIVKQNNADLCEALVKALEHESVTDINLKKLYAFDVVRIEKAMNELSAYCDPSNVDSIKERVLENLHSKLTKELAVCYQPEDEDPENGDKERKTMMYPSLTDVETSQDNILSRQVKKIACKMNMYKILHAQDAILEKHRNPKLIRIIGDLLLALGFGFTLNCINKSLTGYWSFFNQDTTSMQCVTGVDKAMFTEENGYQGMSRLTK
jgi:hypothetical protein